MAMATTSPVTGEEALEITGGLLRLGLEPEERGRLRAATGDRIADH
ncbi:hypothetical protein [Streptomyces sp. NPDC006333]